MCTRLHVCISNIQWIFYNDGRRDDAPDFASHRSTFGTRSRVLQAKGVGKFRPTWARNPLFSGAFEDARIFVEDSISRHRKLATSISSTKFRPSEIRILLANSRARLSVNGSNTDRSSPRLRICVKPPCARALSFKVSLFKVKAFNGYSLFFPLFPRLFT
jgi:hypothetical protein